jgi:hypothetical protein
MVGGQMTKPGKILEGLGGAALFEQPSRRFREEENSYAKNASGYYLESTTTKK